MKVLMSPHIYQLKEASTDGISQVVRAYFKYLPEMGIDLVLPDTSDFDLLAVHAGLAREEVKVDVSHLHGLYWTADYPAASWEFKANQRIIDHLRGSVSVTVPSPWVAEAFQRDMHINPHVVPHGIDPTLFEPGETGDYILWNKNRVGDVCDPAPIANLASRFPKGRFASTYGPEDGSPIPDNLHLTGLLHHKDMLKAVQGALVYLATTKETFGIGILEAMAYGVPVLGFDHGGVTQLVEHGVTGYLAKPGDFEDLAEGLNYCLKHRETLSANARTASFDWPWETACAKVAEVYEEALDIKYQAPSVGVVIPVYNKTSEQLVRAVTSAVNQSMPAASITVVDDGSDPVNSAKYEAIIAQDFADSVRYVHQDNKGVAHARNRGIELTPTKYVTCLDSDDAIAPDFLETCVNALEQDYTLGIAYTRIWGITPEGEQGTTKWPDTYDFERQLAKANQVPTCCVFRREAWVRTGGYRQRYAPDGAGAEDGELWLRMGALGFKGQLVTQDPLFIYSLGQGLVGGNRNYKEPNWTRWHPWVKDKQHPFASAAKPRFLSHPVRQYDEPLISVIIPVGPNHAQHLWNALDSLEAQTFRKWEAIVVWDDFELDAEVERLGDAFPFVRWGSTGNQESGAGVARNIGLEMARGPFVVFLDADDWLYPDYMEEVLREWAAGPPAVIYTDYVGKATVSDPSKLAPDLQNRIYMRDERTNLTVMGWRAADYDCERAQRQPEGDLPWIWTNVTGLYPTAWLREMGGFNEEIVSWEDALLHFRLARQGRCYRKVSKELYVYCLHHGERRERGRQKHASLLQSIRVELEKEEIMPCPGGCGGKKVIRTPSYVSPVQSQAAMAEEDDFLLVLYTHPNRGDHGVIGSTLFQDPIAGLSMTRTREGYRINYGHQPGGGQVRFRVHREDAKANPYFVPVQQAHVAGVMEQFTAPPPPPPRPTVDKQPPPLVNEMVLTTPPTPQESGGVLELELFGEKEKVQLPPQGERLDEMLLDLQAIPGIGPATAKVLVANGVASRGQVLDFGIEGLEQFPGISRAKAEGIIAFITSKQKERDETPTQENSGGMQGGVLSLEDLG
jgi:glycosyltransferase involved in cell wall biosynthesis